MKTTVEIDDTLLRDAKEIAARTGTTLRALVEQGLRAVLTKQNSAKPFKLEIKPFYGTGVRPGYEVLTREKINEIAYGDDDDFK